MKNYTITQFRKEYSTDAVCLDKIWKLKFGNLTTCPKCLRETTFRRITTRTCYQCVNCYHQIHPTKNTIFEKSTTPLILWFYAMYLFTASKNGLSAKEIERQLGVSYKTAWRMLMQIRSLLDTDIELLEGVFEVDETYVGGKNKNRHKDKRVMNSQGRAGIDKTPVFGMLNRQGNVYAYKVPDTTILTLMPIIKAVAKEGSTLHTDEFNTYKGLKNHNYQHETVNHSIGNYTMNDCTTNRMENYWSIVKRTIHGSYITVSRKYLQEYVNEVSFKYNNRGNKNLFNTLLENVPKKG